MRNMVCPLKLIGSLLLARVPAHNSVLCSPLFSSLFSLTLKQLDYLEYLWLLLEAIAGVIVILSTPDQCLRQYLKKHPS